MNKASESVRAARLDRRPRKLPLRRPNAPLPAPPRKTAAQRKEIANLERSIAQLDAQKREANRQLLETTDAAEALRLHNEVTSLTAQIAEAEERWCQLQEEVAAE